MYNRKNRHVRGGDREVSFQGARGKRSAVPFFPIICLQQYTVLVGEVIDPNLRQNVTCPTNINELYMLYTIGKAHLHSDGHVLGVALDVALLSLGRGYRNARPARLRLSGVERRGHRQKEDARKVRRGSAFIVSSSNIMKPRRCQHFVIATAVAAVQLLQFVISSSSSCSTGGGGGGGVADCEVID